jgi:hypothetical protein
MQPDKIISKAVEQLEPPVQAGLIAVIEALIQTSDTEASSPDDEFLSLLFLALAASITADPSSPQLHILKKDQHPNSSVSESLEDLKKLDTKIHQLLLTTFSKVITNMNTSVEEKQNQQIRDLQEKLNFLKNLLGDEFSD